MYIKWEKPDLNQRARALLILLTVNLFGVFFFQRNVTYSVHCNRHVLSAVNFHNRHTDDDGCTRTDFENFNVESPKKVQSCLVSEAYVTS